VSVTEQGGGSWGDMNMAYGNTLMFQQRPPMAGCNKFRLHLTVMAFAHDPQTGELREIQTLSTLPAEVTERKVFRAPRSWSTHRAGFSTRPTGATTRSRCSRWTIGPLRRCGPPIDSRPLFPRATTAARARRCDRPRDQARAGRPGLAIPESVAPLRRRHTRDHGRRNRVKDSSEHCLP